MRGDYSVYLKVRSLVDKLGEEMAVELVVAKGARPAEQKDKNLVSRKDIVMALKKVDGKVVHWVIY